MYILVIYHLYLCMPLEGGGLNIQSSKGTENCGFHTLPLTSYF